MTWIIGIDEAGYGPNLGPFVMTSVSCRVPDDRAGECFWSLLGKTVRRGEDPDDGRLLVDDSKVVYSTTRGLLGLERGVRATLGRSAPKRLGAWLEELCAEGHSELSDEAWYRGDTDLPTVASHEELEQLADGFTEACAAGGVTAWRARSVVICPPRFNALVDAAGSKGAVLAHALATLLRNAESHAGGGDPVRFTVDKHGGRNTYAAFIQHALPDGVVLAREEGMARSVYGVRGLGREVELTFQPRADAEHFCVALASMVSKYVRELCMGEFNRFWLERVTGLKPTAGYPGDSARFWKAIRPAAKKIGLSEVQIWRQK
jgi:hypothetical protein